MIAGQDRLAIQLIDPDDVHQRLQWEVEQLHKRYGGLPSPHEATDVWPRIWYEEAHNSTAIEGNTLVLREVETLLRDNRAVGSKELKDYMEVQGYAEAAQWVYEQALNESEAEALLSLTEVRHVHHLAMSRVWDIAPHPNAFDDESPGSWRRHNIQAFPGGMKPPDFTDIQPRMSDWVDAVNAVGRPVDHIADQLARLHSQFECLHPFLDGNGRAGRLLMNLVLVRLGYPPALILKRDRGRYLKALDAADGGNVTALGKLIARAILDNLYRFVVPAVAGPARLVALEALAKPGLGSDALRKAAERGRLRAMRSDLGTWMSTRQWLQEYERTRYVRSPRSGSMPPRRARRTTFRPYVEAEEVILPGLTLHDMLRKSLAVRLTNLGREPARALLAHLYHPQLVFRRDRYLPNAEKRRKANPDLRGEGTTTRTLKPGESIDACFFLNEALHGPELANTAWLFVQCSDLRGQLWLTTVPFTVGGVLHPPYGQLGFAIQTQLSEVRPIATAYLHEDRTPPDPELFELVGLPVTA